MSMKRSIAWACAAGMAAVSGVGCSSTSTVSQAIEAPMPLAHRDGQSMLLVSDPLGQSVFMPDALAKAAIEQAHSEFRFSAVDVSY